MSSTKKASFCALCIAFCYVLPLAFHAVGLGSVFSPIHIPVLLCGLLCGWGYGAFSGVAGPVISCVLSGMPAPTQLIYMVPELLVYGLVCGLVQRLVKTKSELFDLYLALVLAMLLGRLAGGAAQALFYLSNGTPYSVSLWATAYFVKSIPAIAVQLVVLPPLVMVLRKTGLAKRG